MPKQGNINDPQWRFASRGAPECWLRQADLLKESADVLLVHHLELQELVEQQAKPGAVIPALAIDQSIPMYLYALAIEMVVKGIIVARDPSRLQSGRMAWPHGGHCLRELFGEAGVPFRSRYEKGLVCQQFQAFLDWSGRYPIPKNKHKLMASPLWYQGFLSTGTFEEVYGPLRERLVDEIKRGRGP